MSVAPDGSIARNGKREVVVRDAAADDPHVLAARGTTCGDVIPSAVAVAPTT